MLLGITLYILKLGKGLPYVLLCCFSFLLQLMKSWCNVMKLELVLIHVYLFPFFFLFLFLSFFGYISFPRHWGPVSPCCKETNFIFVFLMSLVFLMASILCNLWASGLDSQWGSFWVRLHMRFFVLCGCFIQFTIHLWPTVY